MKDSSIFQEEIGGILTFIKTAERLKTTYRSGFTSDGREESVAEHTWRILLIAITLHKYYLDLDLVKLTKILVIHDLGEIINGDIPAIYQDPNENKNDLERKDFREVIAPLPKDLKEEFLRLWDDYNEMNTKEARLAKALDKIETILQHTQGKNPENFDYAFNLTYGKQHTDFDEVTRHIRSIIDMQTKSKIS